MTKPNSTVDWERIEADYRAGILSVREIAGVQGVSHVAIAKRAKKEGWERDLQGRIRAKADALVTKQTVTNKLEKAKLVTDSLIVEANAQAVANVRLSHRRDISRYRDHARSLIAELEKLGCEEGTLGARINNMKAASETLKTLVTLEREAWGIQNSNEGETPQTITKLVREIVRPS